MWSHGETRAAPVARCDLRIVDEAWAFAALHASDIDAHWQCRRAENPGFFNGDVHLLSDFTLDGTRAFKGRFLRTDFKSFLYWRETGWRDRQVMDAFGSALIFSADGQVLLGQQHDGHLNSGLTYLPGGFIDLRDVGPGGAIDIEGSVRREVSEETGLDTRTFTRTEGYVIAVSGPLLSIAVGWRSGLNAAELAHAARRHIESEPDSELASVVTLTPGQPPPEGIVLSGTVGALFGHLASSKSGT
jgi:8-oxo-dGTP pyrophosphatase MutT (NUDIX family)